MAIRQYYITQHMQHTLNNTRYRPAPATLLHVAYGHGQYRQDNARLVALGYRASRLSCTYLEDMYISLKTRSRKIHDILYLII